MNKKKYQKYLSKYLKRSSTDDRETLEAFKREFGHLKKEGLEIHGLASLGDENVISVSLTSTFNKNKIPKSYRGLIIRQ